MKNRHWITPSTWDIIATGSRGRQAWAWHWFKFNSVLLCLHDNNGSVFKIWSAKIYEIMQGRYILFLFYLLMHTNKVYILQSKTDVYLQYLPKAPHSAFCSLFNFVISVNSKRRHLWSNGLHCERWITFRVRFPLRPIWGKYFITIGSGLSILVSTLELIPYF